MALVLASNQYTALFDVSAPTEVRLEAEGRGGGDPLIELRDAAGTVLLSDDDSGGEGSAFAETSLEPGTYCLSMKSYDGAPMTGFVRVGRLEQERLTAGTALSPPTGDLSSVPSDTVGPPGEPAGGAGCSGVANYLASGPVDGSLSMGGASMTAAASEVDAWGFSLAAPQAVTITATNETADPSITLYDAQGTYLADNDDHDGLNSQIDMTMPLDAGDYCIEVQALSDANAPITVSVVGYDPMAALDNLIANGEASPPMDGTYPIENLGVLTNRIRRDAQIGTRTSWFQIDVDQGGLVLIEAVANGNGDPIAFLYDDIGRQVAMNDDNGTSYDSMIAARVLPGSYLLGIKQYDASQTSLVRLVIERYVPAQ